MRLFRTLVATCGVAALSACSLLNNSDDNPPADATGAAGAAQSTTQQGAEVHPPQDVTVGEMLNAGVYAPDSTAYGIFRPCGGDISLERLRDIGWDVESINGDENDVDNASVNDLAGATASGFFCFIKGIPGKQLGEGQLSVNYKTYEDVTQLEGVREAREDLNKLKVTKPAGYYVHDAETSTTDTDKIQKCSAGVMTKRGRVTFDYHSPFMDSSTTGKEKVCQTAVDSLQAILDTPITAAAPPAPETVVSEPAAAPEPESAPAQEPTPESGATPAPESASPAKPVAYAAPAPAPELKFRPSPGLSSAAPAPNPAPTNPAQPPQSAPQSAQPAHPSESPKPDDSQVPTFSKVLGVGEYKPQDKVRDPLGIFNGCAEITAEQWKSIGFTQFSDSSLSQAQKLPPYYSCFYRKGADDKEFQEMFALETSFNSLAGKMKIMTPLDHIKVNKPENFYLMERKNAKEQQCSVGVVTSRGRITADYGKQPRTEPSITKEEACQRVVDNLQALLNLKYEPPAEKPTETVPELAPKSTPKSQAPSETPADSQSSDASKDPEDSAAKNPEPAPNTSGA